MGVTERDAALDEPVGDIGREGEALRCELRHARGVEPHGRDHAREGRKHHLERRDRVEDGLLVLLQIAVVGEREDP